MVDDRIHSWVFEGREDARDVSGSQHCGAPRRQFR